MADGKHINSAILSFAGRQFYFDDIDGADQVASQIRAGTFEIPLPLMVMAHMTRMKGVFVDVGANSGLYTILAAITDPDISVLSFEPYPVVRDILNKNVLRNGLEGRVEIFGTALSNMVGEFPLYIPDDSHGLIETSCSLESTFKKQHKGSVNVKVTKLDLMNIVNPISVIKVDIEGHECSFLDGARKTIEHHRPVIFCEMLWGVDTKFYQNFLPQMGYVDFRLREDIAIRDSITRFDVKSLNHALVPVDKLPVFYDCCRTHGIEVAESVVI
ncbi:FkbM family methyltransferase [Acetobacter fallax]|uniref:FkbM family methyltransferase n=1 Tax=Acetobacter fallax TaxID=1737473 RepID=A0ABX0KBP8_9PROT|nr:FkbM family methyltransferase [Acetobacter fallax]NHO32864.1 FkbM family methyltransferase [Acetobacter fallax]NHO36426.1 FkbM family methyltransferase [Acetobacter fallax]